MKKHLGVLLAAAATAVASFALLASAAQAATPAPPYEDFAGCPSPAENNNVAFCFKTVFTGGHVDLGSREVPISNPVTLRGGISFLGANYLANSEGGIVPVQQKVPGGLIGLTGMSWLDELLDQPQLRLYATIELAGTPGSLEVDPWTLPIKVHLENPVLGSNCFIGSDANPINLRLTTGTTNPPAPNAPISGTEPGEFESEASRPEVLLQKGGSYVDNAYAVPAANGCQIQLGSITIPVNGFINATSHLPAAAGTNEAALNFERSLVLPEVVYP